MEKSRGSFVKQYEPDVESSTWIARPPEEIWDYLTDVSNEPKWRDIMIEARWVSDPPYGIGSTGLNVVKGVGDWPWEITEWDEPYSMGWDVTGGRFEGSHGGYYVVSENAGSRVSAHAQFKPGTYMRILKPIMIRYLGRQFAAELEKLKAILEG